MIALMPPSKPDYSEVYEALSLFGCVAFLIFYGFFL